MHAGQVLFWPDHVFEDGDSSDKLLIVLNNMCDALHLAAYTTSQYRVGLPETEGCHPGEGVYFIPAKRWGFKKDTWVQLWRVQEYDAYELDTHCTSGRVKELRTLEQSATAALVNCYVKCPDSSEHHEWLLGKRKTRPV